MKEATQSRIATLLAISDVALAIYNTAIPLKKPKKKDGDGAFFGGATLHLSAPSAQSLASLPALYCYHHPLRYAYVFQLAPSHRQEGVAQVVNTLHIQP